MARRKRVRRKQKATQKLTGLGEALFFGVAIALGLIPFFLKDALGLQYRWLGTYVWLAGYFFSFFFYLFYLLPVILPLDWRDSFYEGLRLVLPFNFPILDALFSFGIGRSAGLAATTSAATALPQGFLRHRAGIIASQYALALTSGPKYVRSAGPGYLRLNAGELVAQVVDLRLQQRRTTVRAMTRDGIPLESLVSIIFQVKQEEPDAGPLTPYPYDPGAIFWVNYLDNIRFENDTLPWSEHIVPQVSNALVGEISRHTLAEIFQPQQPQISAVQQIHHNAMDQLIKELDRYGLAVIRLHIDQFKLPDEVINQYHEKWQTAFEDRTQSKANSQDMEFQRRLEIGQARAQYQLIRNVIESVETLRQTGGADLSEIVVNQIAEAMSNAAGDEQMNNSDPRNVRAGVNAILSSAWRKGTSP